MRAFEASLARHVKWSRSQRQRLQLHLLAVCLLVALAFGGAPTFLPPYVLRSSGSLQAYALDRSRPGIQSTKSLGPQAGLSTSPLAIKCCAGTLTGVAVSYFHALRLLTASQATEKEKEIEILPKKKPRIDAFDSLRFFLIFYIASGHFIFTATKNPFVLALIGQINVVVGAFFALSGYVIAYTTTELGERKYNEKRLGDAVTFAVSRIMGFWPLHLFVLALFSPMFLWVDATYLGMGRALFNGFISVTMLQAWFPISSEVWNAPTWFLSALSFSMCILPYGLRILAGQNKSELRRTLAILTVFNIAPKLGYSHDLAAYSIFEGMLNARTHPNYALFNATRFSPFTALIEVLLGAAACRLVMLDTDEETSKTGSPVLPLIAILGLLSARAMRLIAINDPLVRTVIFMPLFLMFMMRLHRQSVGPGGKSKLLPAFLNTKAFIFLGSISFPIFIVHSPIGQIFYKKVIATALFGGSLARYPWFFGVYWLVVLTAAYACQKLFVENKKVKEVSNSFGLQLIKRLSG